MLWGYMEDVKSYFSYDLYEKYGQVFGEIWIATAYKGASGELAVITSIEHHYRNHISWLDVMDEKIRNNILKFKGNN
jgi:hexosaminidase